MNRWLSVRSVFVFLLVTLVVFGPKVSIIDTSFLAVVAAVALVGGVVGRIPAALKFVLIALLLYLAYIIFIQLIYGGASNDVILRTVRAFALTLFIAGCYDFFERGEVALLNYALGALFVHSLAVIVGGHVESVNKYLGIVFGNDRVRAYRSSGLVAGFDVAGFFSLIGLVAAAKGIFPAQRWHKWVFIVLHFYAISMTSRLSLIIGIIALFHLFVWKSATAKGVPLLARLSTMVIGGVIVAFGFYEIAAMLEVAFGLGIVPVSDEAREAIVSRFATSTVEDVGLISMYYLPEGLTNIIFGSGQDAQESDVGYVKFIFWHGIFGLTMLISILAYLFGATIRNYKLSGANDRIGLTYFVFLLAFALTFKNNYLLTRGVWSLMLILFVDSLLLRSFRVRGLTVQKHTLLSRVVDHG